MLGHLPATQALWMSFYETIFATAKEPYQTDLNSAKETHILIMLGRLSSTQAPWLSSFETIFATANVSVCMALGVNDIGGSMSSFKIYVSFVEYKSLL